MPGPQLNHAVPDAQRLKAALPDVPIVWGGYFPSAHADTVLKENYVDYCIHSQGEQTFLELMRVLTQGGSLGGIFGHHVPREWPDQAQPAPAADPARQSAPLALSPAADGALLAQALPGRAGGHAPLVLWLPVLVQLLRGGGHGQQALAARVGRARGAHRKVPARPIRRRRDPVSRYGFLRVRGAHGRIRGPHHRPEHDLVGAGAGGRADALQRRHLAQDESQRPEDGV